MARLALVMIARNEAPRIGRALASVRGHIDRMLVLDTGSTDDTVAIAQAHGAEVRHFTWCDDFAAARNVSLDLADADWNLVMDADEWIDGSAEALANLPSTPCLGEVQNLNAIPQGDGEGVSATWIARLLPRGVRYEGRIHEQPASTLPTRRTTLRLGHDGYLPEARVRKAGRNETLLVRELEQAPDDPYLWFQLGRELQGREDNAAAAQALVRAYNLCPPGVRYRHALVVRAIVTLRATGALDEARAMADAEAQTWAGSPDFWFVVGDLYLEWSSRHPDQAVSQGLPVCEYAWKRCLELGERDDYDGAVRGRGGFMAAHNLAVMFETFGLAEQAHTYRVLAEDLKRAA